MTAASKYLSMAALAHAQGNRGLAYDLSQHADDLDQPAVAPELLPWILAELFARETTAVSPCASVGTWSRSVVVSDGLYIVFFDRSNHSTGCCDIPISALSAG